MSTCSEVEVIVHHMMKNFEESSDYVVEFEGGNPKDGYLGDIKFFEVRKSDGKTLKCLMKIGKNNDYLLEKLPMSECYARELHMYSVVFPNFRSFLNQKTPKLEWYLEKCIPKMLYFDCTPKREILIMENLKARNFELWKKSEPLNIECFKLAFETYGRYHGISMAFRDQNRVKFDEMFKNYFDIRGIFMQTLGIHDLTRKEMAFGMKMLKEAGRSDLINIYEKLEKNFEDTLNRKVDGDDLICLTHGDPWINNYMFKFKDNDLRKVEEMCLVDFQLASIDSPIVDIGSFFYNLADKNIYLNFENLLKIYHESLEETLKNLGCSPEIFTMKDLKRHWAIHGYLSVLNSPILLKIQLCESDEAPDFLKIAENGESFCKTFHFDTINIEKIRTRMLNAIVHYGEFLKFYRE